LILIGLRLVQGFAVGGEWAGSVSLSAEYAPDGRRGLFGMFTLLGGGTAAILSSLTFLGVNYTIGENSPAFMQWGWRVPFLISTVMIVVALYVRANIEETPVFADEEARHLIPKAPVTEALRLQRREIVLAAGSLLGSLGFVYMANTFLTMYAHSHLGYSRSLIWTVAALGGVVSMISVATSATLSDRVGRRRLMLVGWAGCVPWAFVVIPLINSGNPVLYAVAIMGMLAIGGIGAGPSAAFIPELFATRYRYSGTALSVNVAGIIGGALPPLIAGTLLATYGSWSIGVMLAVLALASLVCTYLLPETSGAALDQLACKSSFSAMP
jgi:MFS family permease